MWIAPPNWPSPPATWTRRPSWQPDPAWGAPPARWVFRPRDDRRARSLAALDAASIVAFLVVYALVIRSQGGSPAYWFVALLGAALLLALVAAVRGGVVALLTNVVIVSVCAFLGLLSVGVLLAPAVITGVAGSVLASRSRRP